jgi:glycogen phosphorylase
MRHEIHHFLPRALPEGLEPLTELALDVRWTWSHSGDALWRRLDPALWERTRNPWAMLQNIAQADLESIARDAGWRSELVRAVEERERYLAEPTWYANLHGDASLGMVAYFSMEFGLSEAFPLYAGGLGVLAGDYLKTASDLGVPAVGVGLLYQEGYFRQLVDAAGWQREAYPYNNPMDLPIQPVFDSTGRWLLVELALPGRTVYLRAWQAKVGRVRLYLLDSNDLRNGPGDRGITAKLYGGGPEMRLTQEIVLGIGGWTLLDRLGIEAEVCHLNEGHAAFAILERARQFSQETGASFQEAWWATRAGNVFTTHTPVAAGFDAFAPDLVQQYFRDYQERLGIAARDFLALGRKHPSDDAEPFNTAYLALRGCARANGVSRRHGEVSRRLFSDLYPAWPEREVPIGSVTNGIHVPSWDSPAADRLWTRACGKGRWLGAVDKLAEAVGCADDETVWALAAQERQALVGYARQRLAWQLAQRGAKPQAVGDAERVLDPNVLTLGFARRFAEYKRPNLLLLEPQRLARLLLDPDRPVQIIVAGKAHPDDAQGKQLVAEWLEFTNRPDIRGRAVFIEDYDMALAQELVQGVDLWINTPRRPMEACGTSGMKVLANGGLNLSTLDGWWAEAYSAEVGWAIGDEPSQGGQDEADAQELYRLLEAQVVPLFYERDKRGVPRKWVSRMRASISRLTPVFSSNRMLQEYVETLYLPAASAIQKRQVDQGRLAKDLHAWHTKVAQGWHEVHWGCPTALRVGEQWHFEVPLYLGEIPSEWVKVELYADALPGLAPVQEPMAREGAIVGAMNGYVFSANVPASRPEWHYTARAMAFHPDAITPIECPLIAWQR